MANPMDRDQRRWVQQRRVDRQQIGTLAARLANAIRFDDGDAVDRAQAALHELDHQHPVAEQPTR